MAHTDFDFLFGRWSVRHRRLRERLVGDSRWDGFGGSVDARPLLGGHGNIDESLIDLPSGPYRAATLRAFDAASDRWAIWWLDGRYPHRLDVPMIGSFAGGLGTFLADDTLDGRPIRVRFLWSDIAARSCRWQQAFSADGGGTWETNWVMDFSRLD